MILAHDGQPCIIAPPPYDKYGYARVSPVRAKKDTLSGSCVVSRETLWRQVGPPPNPRMFACHTCDNPPCVRPSHLFWGTGSENLRDCVAKGRWKPHPPRPCLLSANDIEALRDARASGATYAQLQNEFGVSHGTVSNVLNRTGGYKNS